jgi:hypothetical protein
MKYSNTMTIDEKTRLDLRQEFEKLMGTRLADAAMEAMPPLDYDQLATKTDVTNLGIELRGEMAEMRGEMAEMRSGLHGEMAGLRSGLHGEMAGLRGEIAGVRGEISELRGDLKNDMANQLRIMMLTQVTTIAAVVGVMARLA